MGYAAWPNNTGAIPVEGRFIRFGKFGSGDIIVLLPTLINGKTYGMHGEVECKTGEAIQRKSQKTHMRVVRKYGGIYVVARSTDDMKSQLAHYGYVGAAAQTA